MVDHHFFDFAFDMYRKKYQHSDNQVIFLVVSDDSQWVKVQAVPINLILLSIFIKKDNLGKHSDVRFGSDYSEKHLDKEDLAGFDLCVLSKNFS